MGKPQKSSKSDELLAAARSGDIGALQSILSADPLAVNSRDKHSRTPDAGNRLHLAAWSGQTEVVSYLCNHRADVGAAAMDDMAAIHFAAQKGHLEVVRTLLSSGASVKALTRKGLTPLHYAAQGSNVDLVKYLVRKGANLSLKTKAGKTPLDVANNDEIRSYLEECEKKGDLKESDQISSPKQGDLKESDQISSPKQEQNADTEAAEVARNEQEDKSLKRKAEEDDVKKEALDPKRNKNVLSHLYTDDTQEDEEDY